MAERKEKLIDLTVAEDAAGERADVFLQQAFPEVSRSRLQNLLKQGFITASGKTIKPSEKLTKGLILRGRIPLLRTDSGVQPVAVELAIVYEDDDVIVINKPAGLTVHPGAGAPEPTVAGGLVYRYQNLPGSDPIRPGIVHRLDKMTSGLMVCAKSHRAMASLGDQFREKTAGRSYLALVDGVPSWNQQTADTMLGRDPDHRLRFKVIGPGDGSGPVGSGKRAVSHFQVQAIYGHRLALVAARLETGRTHQIRVHLAHLGFPIVGDLLYHRPVALPLSFSEAIRSLVWRLDRQLLHAEKLGFIHPQTAVPQSFVVPPPDPLADLLRQLEPYRLT